MLLICLPSLAIKFMIYHKYLSLVVYIYVNLATLYCHELCARTRESPQIAEWLN